MIDTLVRVMLPSNKRPRIRWIVGEKNNRFIVRAPKIGVSIQELKLFRNNDYGKETLLPLNSKILK